MVIFYSISKIGQCTNTQQHTLQNSHAKSNKSISKKVDHISINKGTFTILHGCIGVTGTDFYPLGDINGNFIHIWPLQNVCFISVLPLLCINLKILCSLHFFNILQNLPGWFVLIKIDFLTNSTYKVNVLMKF